MPMAVPWSCVTPLHRTTRMVEPTGREAFPPPTVLNTGSSWAGSCESREGSVPWRSRVKPVNNKTGNGKIGRINGRTIVSLLCFSLCVACGDVGDYPVGCAWNQNDIVLDSVTPSSAQGGDAESEESRWSESGLLESHLWDSQMIGAYLEVPTRKRKAQPCPYRFSSLSVAI